MFMSLHSSSTVRNNHPIFTDQELLTVYLFCGAYQQYFKIKDIHTFTKEYLLS